MELDSDEAAIRHAWQNRTWYYQEAENTWIEVTWEELQERNAEGIVTPDTLVTFKEMGYGFPFRYIDADYFYLDRTRNVEHAYSEAELTQAFAEGKLRSDATVWGRTLPLKGIPYASVRFSDLILPDIRGFLKARKDCEVTVLSGPNNSGKSLILKLIRSELGPTANLLACSRFYPIDRLGPASEQGAQYRQRHDSFVTQLYQPHQNVENNDYPVVQVLGQMTDEQRDLLLALCADMLGETFELKQVDPRSKLSQYYVEVSGQSLTVASAGTRLLLMIVAACLDDNCSTVLVDEPEIGLSPRLQLALAKYLLDPGLRKRYFPHLRRLILATHSHLFLDRNTLSNNFVVTKADNRISIDQVLTMAAYHELEFNMLGNDLQALFLPAAIVVVEGDTDYDFMKKVLGTQIPDKRVSVVWSQGADDTKNRLHTIQDSLGDLMTSPYRDRIFILMDKKHIVRDRDFTRYGIPADHVVKLEQNGIEYYYPPEILGEIFASKDDPLSAMVVHGNSVRVHGIERTKKELGREVIARMTDRSTIHKELVEKLLNPIRRILGLENLSSKPALADKGKV